MNECILKGCGAAGLGSLIRPGLGRGGYGAVAGLSKRMASEFVRFFTLDPNCLL